MKSPTPQAAGRRRHAIQLLEPIDGSWRPFAPNGKPLDYDSPAHARAVASGYRHLGAAIRVHDTKGGGK